MQNVNNDTAYEIVTKRTVNARQATVFEAWTNPAYLAQWWGPKGYTNTFKVHELKPGGEWIFIMHGPDGRNHDNACEYKIVQPNERLEWRHLSNPGFDVKVSFEEEGDKTHVTFRMIFDTEHALNAKLAAPIAQLNEENMDKLEAILATMQ